MPDDLPLTPSHPEGQQDHRQDHKPDKRATADPFADLSKLRISQDFAAGIGVKKALITVPVRKPDRQWFVRVHPEEDFRLQTAVLELRDEREAYLVARELWADLSGEVVPKVLFTAINRQGVVFLWGIRLPGDDGRLDEWNRSALEAAEKAQSRWVRIASNQSLRAYEVWEASTDLPEPEWPDQPLQELLRIGFRDRFIDSLDHPVLKRLRGEA